MKLSNLFKHLSLVLRHKWRVFINCAKCGLVWRGLVHDLSKFSPSEFFESVKYYQGNRSPLGVCRKVNGYSAAWLHHKGRNKHHIEYWTDRECEVQPLMPYKYAVECACDKLAATRIYAGKNYSDDLALKHWKKHGCNEGGNPKTMRFMEEIFIDVMNMGEKAVLNKKYMKDKYKKICLDEEY